MDVQDLLKLAEHAGDILREASILVDGLFAKYRDIRDTLSESDKAVLDAKLASLRQKSADIHAEIQAQG